MTAPVAPDSDIGGFGAGRNARMAASGSAVLI
jgi:hypothetical protein